jgi:hypothetical protein
VATSNIQKRRKIRELEAKRDKLMEATAKAKADLVQVRSALKFARKQGVQ